MTVNLYEKTYDIQPTKISNEKYDSSANKSV